ncbi:hypothetical protein [Alteromonas sp. CYL-A6]|uniref:hypothetical protein n=1 Tax=Alteromonas nitratireducens TaxID=3390813 RepID=UPI0034AC45B8
METLNITLLIIALVVGGLIVSYLDARFHWRLADWLNGRCTNPFIPAQPASGVTRAVERDSEIAALKERVAALEAIVTEPAYDIKQQIDRLR